MSTSDQVSTHVAAARNLAACLEAVGVGTHPTRGHAAILRRMANHIETEAAKNHKPSEFNDAVGLHAAADNPSGVVYQLSAAMNHRRDPLQQVLKRIGLDAAASRGEKVSIAEVDERLKQAGITGHQAIAFKLRLAELA